MLCREGLPLTYISGRPQAGSPPNVDVVVPRSSSDDTEGCVLPATLTFTSGNWDIPQVVTVTGLNDDLLDGDIVYAVEIGPAVSDDSGYNGNNPADKVLTNIDTDLNGDDDGISDEKEGSVDSVAAQSRFLS